MHAKKIPLQTCIARGFLLLVFDFIYPFLSISSTRADTFGSVTSGGA